MSDIADREADLETRLRAAIARLKAKVLQEQEEAATDQPELQENALAPKTLAVEKSELHVAEIVQHGEQLIIPEKMSLDDAIKLIMLRKSYLQQTINVNRSYKAFPWDGANALALALQEMYGWAPTMPTTGFFGEEIPPQMISIEVGPGINKEVPWGKMGLPHLGGKESFVQTGVQRTNEGFVFALVAKVTRQHEQSVRNLFDKVGQILRERSIYRGQAIRIRFRDDDGDLMPMPDPKFIDTSVIDEEMLLFNDDIQASVETNLFTPIVRARDCIANDIPIKRGVLLGGTFGTGKTLAATVASKHAVDAGITYVYVPRADELQDALLFAKQYQSPACVVFCEDIDRATSGERSVSMDDILNTLDGMDTKNSHIITVLTTNDLDAIHPSMLRPGRLDAVIQVIPPDAKTAARLLKHYGGDLIDPKADLTAAGKELANQIPATIAEVVKRAKLAELRRTKPGQPINKLSSDSLLEAARTMRGQMELLERRLNPKQKEVPPLDQAIQAQVTAAFANSIREIAEVHRRVVQ